MPLRDIDAYALPAVTRHDSLSAFVGQELLQIMPELYNRKFPLLDATRWIPGKSNINPGAMAWAFYGFDQRGEARFLGQNANDIPRADISKDMQAYPIRTIVSSYGWTLEEMENARFSGTPLETGKADAARRAIAELEYRTLLFGSAERNIPGFLNNPNVPIVEPTTGGWATATVDQIIDDLTGIVDAVPLQSNETHRTTVVLLPYIQWRRVQTARIANTSETALSFVQKVNPGIEFGALRDLATAGEGGTTRAVAYERDPMNLGAVIPLAFQQIDPQVWGMETVVPVRERIGGTVVFYPYSMAYIDGI